MQKNDTSSTTSPEAFTAHQEDNTLKEPDRASDIPDMSVGTVRTGSHPQKPSQAISVGLQQADQSTLRSRRQRTGQVDLRLQRATASTMASDAQEAIDISQEGLQNGQHSTRSPFQAAHLAGTPESDHGTAPLPLPLSNSDTHTLVQQLQSRETTMMFPRSQDGLQDTETRRCPPYPWSFKVKDWVKEQLRDAGKLLWLFVEWLWWISKWPIPFTLATLLLLQLIALGYTFTSQAYLSHFCTKNLPYVRDWMCSEWDQSQNNRVDADVYFTEPVVLMHGTNIPWELPLYMTMFETSFQDIRVNTAGSELQDGDKVFFRNMADKYLEHSEIAIENTQIFFNHLASTAQRTVADTETMLIDLEVFGSIDSLFGNLSGPSNESVSSLVSGPLEVRDDFLTTGMGWLASHRLIFLPIGVEPFRESRRYDHQLYAISLMEKHTDNIDRRLLEELAMTADLKVRFRDLADIADGARERLMMRYNEEKKAKIARGDQFWRWAVAKIWGTSMDRYLSDQRMAFLESMAPVYRNASEYLVYKTKALNGIRNACETVHERLRQDRSDLKSGKGISVWLAERYRVLKDGKETLEQELKGWSVQKVQARTHPFQ